MSALDMLNRTDPEIAAAIRSEVQREEDNIILIASENYASQAVLETQGCLMTNKYAEGYPGGRYYGGCAFVDVAERLAIERAKELFHAEHANVQPNTGSAANMAVYFAVLKPGDTILSMKLDHGGHLTHGAPVSFSGKLYRSVFYGVSKETGYIDYDEVRNIALESRPRLIIAGASSYSRILDFKKFREIADEVGALLMVDIAHIAGLVAAKVHPSPVPYSDFVTGTTHKTLRGPRGGFILSKQKYARAVDQAIFPGIQGGPLMHVIAAKAVAFKEALSDEFVRYQKQIVLNAKILAEQMMGYGYKIVSNGTDNHLFLIDLSSRAITGREAEKALDKAGITVNKNAIPFDSKGVVITSGIRLGTPAVTTRGMKETEMRLIAAFIDEVLRNIDKEETISRVREGVRALCSRFPVYGRSSSLCGDDHMMMKGSYGRL